ncbi:MAG: nucleoside phosphorylase [Flavobacteriaceae bacterium]
MGLRPSELILNGDGSIYHLNLLPQDIGQFIITVGDPERVHEVSKYFDHIELKKGKREFHAHTGMLGNKRVTVISTGIGTDNMDIVLNELDALVNVDFDRRERKPVHTPLTIIRIGTSGAIQPNISTDSFVMAEYAIGLDALLHFYESDAVREHTIEEILVQQLDWPKDQSRPYVVKCDMELARNMASQEVQLGASVTNAGFYGPQGRTIRLNNKLPHLNKALTAFQHKDLRLTNLEMETSGIYGLAKLLGHRAVSLNAILANRVTGEFSKTPHKTVENLITWTLETLRGLPSQ